MLKGTFIFELLQHKFLSFNKLQLHKNVLYDTYRHNSLFNTGYQFVFGLLAPVQDQIHLSCMSDSCRKADCYNTPSDG